MSRTKACLWCGSVFEVKRKRVPLCEPCRIDKNREQSRLRAREREEDRQILLSHVLPLVPKELHSRAYAMVDEYLDARSDENLPQEMRMPPGYKSERGPWEGQSSFFADLRGQLKTLANEAAAHEWWAENPPEDVFFELGKIENAKEYFRELAERRAAQSAACGDAIGTHRGYQRHVRAGESACDPCTNAMAEYFREWRSRKKAECNTA